MTFTPKQRRFIKEYPKDLNATRAAERSGFSKKTARQQGARLLSNVNIQEAISRELKKREKRTEITQDRVLKELGVCGFSDIKDYIDIDSDTGAIRAKGFEKMPARSSRALKAIKEDRVIKEDADGKKVTVYDKVRFELWDKPKALELLGKHLGMFIELVKHSGEISTVIKVVSAIPRPGQTEAQPPSAPGQRKGH
jgi:phage terminase small subunit